MEKKSLHGKTSGYEKFSNYKLIHVEDESINNKETKYCISLRQTYPSIKGWYPNNAWETDSKKFKQTDKELLITLGKMRQILI